jgi:hypothetical protein
MFRGDLESIQLLPYPKVKVALDWMLEDSKDCLSERQFGGIPRSSSVLALLEMLHTWFVAFEKPKSVIRIVFLYFSKAFDLIDHNILLNDFKSVGVRPALLPWLASYLSDRLQRVNTDGSTSCFKKINAALTKINYSFPPKTMFF